MNAPRTIVALLLLVLLLAGCGKKGPLYLPEATAATAVDSR
jgi:predicted small lipoprotein YifL